MGLQRVKHDWTTELNCTLFPDNSICPQVSHIVSKGSLAGADSDPNKVHEAMLSWPRASVSLCWCLSGFWMLAPGCLCPDLRLSCLLTLALCCSWPGEPFPCFCAGGVLLLFQFVLTNKLGPTAHHLHNQYSQMSVGRKGAFNQIAGNLERCWSQCSPKNHLQRFFCLAKKVLKGSRKGTSVNHWDRRSESSPSPSVCRRGSGLFNSWSFSGCYLVHKVQSHTLLSLLKEKLRKTSGHLLVIYPSFLLLWSMKRTNKPSNLLCD